jgi:glycosyltransferase involved in cell wall biosynthesis
LFVDNGSDDGTADYLSNQDDVSLWTTQHSYRLSRFGADWLAWLQIKYGHGKWCLTLDADEIFIYPYYKTRSLHALVSWLEAEEEVSFGALMLDMYPKGPIGASDVAPGADPFKALSWFDSGNYTIERQSKLHNLWIQGGGAVPVFFPPRATQGPHIEQNTPGQMGPPVCLCQFDTLAFAAPTQRSL